MTSVSLIAAVARNGVIGSNGEIPWNVPGEQKRFKELTLGHVLVMGRLTYESIGRPLPGRTTIVVSRQPGWQPAGGRPGGLVVIPTVTEALARGAAIDPEVYVAGGARVYADALPLADRLLLTRVDAEPEGDTYFPQVDWSRWTETDREDYEGWSLVRYDRAASS